MKTYGIVRNMYKSSDGMTFLIHCTDDSGLGCFRHACFREAGGWKHKHQQNKNSSRKASFSLFHHALFLMQGRDCEQESLSVHNALFFIVSQVS